MSPIATSLNKTMDYVLRVDKDLPEDKRTVFVLGILPSGKRQQAITLFLKYGDFFKELISIKGDMGDKEVDAKLIAVLTKYPSGTIDSFLSGVRDIVADGLRGWKKFFKDDGIEIKYEKDTVRAILEEFVDIKWCLELFSAILDFNTLSEKDKKN